MERLPHSIEAPTTEELQRALAEGQSLIAIVDPPRAGLHSDCLRCGVLSMCVC